MILDVILLTTYFFPEDDASDRISCVALYLLMYLNLMINASSRIPEIAQMSISDKIWYIKIILSGFPVLTLYQKYFEIWTDTHDNTRLKHTEKGLMEDHGFVNDFLCLISIVVYSL